MEQPVTPGSSRRGWMVWGLIALLLAAGGGGAWWYLAENAAATPPAGQLTIAEREEIFTALMDTVEHKYVFTQAKGLDLAQLRTTYRKQIRQAPDDEGFNRAMLRAVGALNDTHTWLNIPGWGQNNANLRLAMDGDQVVIREVIPNTDADKAGFKPGMVLVQVDGKPVSDLWAEQRREQSDSTDYRRKWSAARYVLFGNPGSTAKVVARGPDGKTVEGALRHNTVGTPVTPVETRTLDGGIIYLRVSTFDSTPAMLRTVDALKDAAAKKAPGLIIDLRGNGGGAVGDGSNLLDYLFAKSVPWGYELGTSSGAGDPLTTKPREVTYDGPVLLLTDPGCVSTCDIVTTALQRSGRAQLVGEPPAGATGNASDFKLPHGYVIHLSAGAQYLGPDKAPTEGHPASVAYPVAPTAADWAAGKDPVLEKALSVLKN